MSVKTNRALFELIKSMSKSEKRYFKVLSSLHTIGGVNNYVILFDYLDEQDDYCEEQLFKDFAGEAFLNRFSITKKRLYDHILSALDSFHSTSSVDAQLFKQLHAIDILYEKSLYDQCRRLISSTEKLIVKYQRNELLLLINQKKRNLRETEGYSSINEEDLLLLSAQSDEALGTIRIHSQIWKVKSELFLRLTQLGPSRSEAQKEVFTKICKPLATLNVSQMNVDGQYLYFHTMSAYYYSIGNLSDSLCYLQKNLDLFKDTDQHLQIPPNKRFSVLTNAIYIADKLGQHMVSLQLLQELKRFANSIEPNEDLAIKIFSSISSIELSIDLRSGAFSEAAEKVEEISKQLKLYADKVSPTRRAFLEYKIAVVHIGNHNFSEALKAVNRILNDPELDWAEDIIGFTQLLDLLIHVELGHIKLLPYSLKSAQRYFKSRNRMHGFERVFLKFIGRLIKSQDHFEVQERWEELYRELSTITQDDNFESIAMDYFDFHSWAEAKLKQKSFDQLVQEKYNNRFRNAS